MPSQDGTLKSILHPLEKLLKLLPVTWETWCLILSPQLTCLFAQWETKKDMESNSIKKITYPGVGINYICGFGYGNFAGKN